MPGSAGAQKAFRFLKSYFAQDTKVTSKCSAVFTIQKGTQIYELTSNIVPLHGDTQEFQFETPIITVPEQYARLNWVFVAPDKYAFLFKDSLQFYSYANTLMIDHSTGTFESTRGKPYQMGLL